MAGNRSDPPPVARMMVVVGVLMPHSFGLVNHQRGYGCAPEFRTGLLTPRLRG